MSGIGDCLIWTRLRHFGDQHPAAAATAGMERKDWLALCAVHSDAWLMSVLFFFAARFDDAGRAELFSLVNQHPTVYEVVTGRAPRNKMNKRKQVVGGRGGQQQQQQQQQIPPQQQQQRYATESRNRTGRLMTQADVGPALLGRQGELYWPDDGMWYLVQVQQLDMATRQATYEPYVCSRWPALARRPPLRTAWPPEACSLCVALNAASSTPPARSRLWTWTRSLARGRFRCWGRERVRDGRTGGWTGRPFDDPALLRVPGTHSCYDAA